MGKISVSTVMTVVIIVLGVFLFGGVSLSIVNQQSVATAQAKLSPACMLANGQPMFMQAYGTNGWANVTYIDLNGNLVSYYATKGYWVSESDPVHVATCPTESK